MSDIGQKDQILKEIHYRRDKQWSIFSWTTSIIIAAIGGVITLSSSNYFLLTVCHGAALALAIFFIGWYSTTWLNENYDRETNATHLIKVLDNVSATLYNEPKKPIAGYAFTIRWLTGIAIVFFIAFPLLQPESSIKYLKKSETITVTLSAKEINYKEDKLDTAIKQFQDYIRSN